MISAMPVQCSTKPSYQANWELVTLLFDFASKNPGIFSQMIRIAAFCVLSLIVISAYFICSFIGLSKRHEKIHIGFFVGVVWPSSCL